jgi:DNA-binding MarR family transcriptional regulator
MSTTRRAAQALQQASFWPISSLPWFLLKPSREDQVDTPNPKDLLNGLLGSAHLFVAAISGVMEHQLLAEVAGSQLTVSQLKILKLLYLTDAQNVGEVAAFLGVSDAAASKAVDRLVRRKLLRRTQGRSDRRSSNLSLALAGLAILKRYETAKDRKLADIFGNLDPGELKQASEFLDRMTTGVVHHSANPEDICLQCGIYSKKRCLVREAGRPECQYQRKKTKFQFKNNATQIEVPKRGRPGLGPPG